MLCNTQLSIIRLLDGGINTAYPSEEYSFEAQNEHPDDEKEVEGDVVDDQNEDKRDAYVVVPISGKVVVFAMEHAVFLFERRGKATTSDATCNPRLFCECRRAPEGG